ncbi:MAG: hypothetical protein ABR521_05350 [Gaiellaceae bacterium]
MRQRSRQLAAALVAVLAALAVCAAAGAVPRFGVADDGGKYADDGGGNFFTVLHEAGLQANRITVFWDPTDGTNGLAIRERDFLDRSMPVAALRGVDVVLSVYPAQPKAFSVDFAARTRLFAQYLQIVAQTYPQVKTFIVGNEPNQPRFWQPQFVRDGRGGHRAVAGARYERVLAAAYDALKAVNPSITVVGLGLSPRGNDRPLALNNISRSPVRFIADMAVEYRRSGRKKPIMDALGFHPYPQGNADALVRGYGWPNAGLRNLDRIKQAIWDGFHGTGQPVFAETGKPGRKPLRFVLDEYGRQSVIISSVSKMYTGVENVKPVDEQTQARMYAEVVRTVACEPSVSDFFLFHLVDDSDLDRFQSGLLRADWTKRPAFDAVRAAIAEGCRRPLHRWRHAETVIGAGATLAGPRVRLTAGEEAQVSARVFRAGTTRAAIARALSGRPGGATHRLLLRAHSRASLPLGTARLAPGTYVAATLFRAALNPARTKLVVTDSFRVE